MKKTNKTEEQLVEEMIGILQEVSDLNGEHIDDSNFRGYYEDAADELEHFEEDEEGEGDIYRFTYEALDDYVTLRNQLTHILAEKGYTLESRKEYYKVHLVWED